MSESANFHAAVRLLRESELRCPRCGAENALGEEHPIHLDPHYMAKCDKCQHVWPDKEQ